MEAHSTGRPGGKSVYPVEKIRTPLEKIMVAVIVPVDLMMLAGVGYYSWKQLEKSGDPNFMATAFGVAGILVLMAFVSIRVAVHILVYQNPVTQVAVGLTGLVLTFQTGHAPRLRQHWGKAKFVPYGRCRFELYSYPLERGQDPKQMLLGGAIVRVEGSYLRIQHPDFAEPVIIPEIHTQDFSGLIAEISGFTPILLCSRRKNDRKGAFFLGRDY